MLIVNSHWLEANMVKSVTLRTKYERHHQPLITNLWWPQEDVKKSISYPLGLRVTKIWETSINIIDT